MSDVDLIREAAALMRERANKATFHCQECTEATGDYVACRGDGAADAGPYFIGYSDMVDGYRHAYAETDQLGRRKIRTTRNAIHPPDPRCPGCAEGTEP